METAALSFNNLIRYLPLAAAAPALRLIVQDCRYGKISAGPLVLLGGIDLAAAGAACGPEILLQRLIWNFLLLAYMAGGIGLWLVLKKKTLSNPFKGYIGSGDFLFAAAVCPLFGFRDFLYFLLISCILPLILRYPVLYFKRMGNCGTSDCGKPGVPSVPLVAYAGTVFIFFLFYKYFFF